jgi:hypothetical protein
VSIDPHLERAVLAAGLTRQEVFAVELLARAGHPSAHALRLLPDPWLAT